MKTRRRGKRFSSEHIVWVKTILKPPVEGGKIPAMRRLAGICACLAASACGPSADAPEPVRRGIQALRELQEPDGAWRSKFYPDLKTGLPLTALALFAFSRLPGPPEAKTAIEFLSKHLDANGQVGNEYPNFTTGMTLRAFRVYRPPGWEESTRRMADYLVKAQVAESSGWAPDDPGYGAWGLGGLPLRQREVLRLDISSTRWALEALAEAGRIDEIRDKALRFVTRCQNDDGGFFYSPAAPNQNKTDPTGGVFPSYGSATADGILALRALGEPERGGRACAWLDRNFSAERTPGFPAASPVRWDQGLLFYYLVAAAAAVEDPDRRRAIIGRLKTLQGRDGLWANKSAVMKEDEPIIATCFALLAISYGLGD